jgi:ribosome-binding protein aMBF1 (putative translation factor)
MSKPGFVCDECAKWGSHTKAVGQSLRADGHIVEMWCLEHAPANRETPAPSTSQRIANLLVMERHRQEVTQYQIAQACQCTKQQIARWEAGEGMTVKSLLVWCRALQVKPSAILASLGF